MKQLKCFLLLLMVSYYAQGQNDVYEYDVEERITQLGIVLHTPNPSAASKIEQATRTGNLVYLSGSLPGDKFIGKVGQQLTAAQGYEAARLVAINHLSVLKATVGDLNKIVKIVKVLGLVNATPDFTEHPSVINGYTDVMLAVFGDRGKHARSAVGMSSLPRNMACEIEAIVEVSQ